MAADDWQDGDLLKGWKEIARFLHASERTVQRWEQALSLPIRRAGPQPGSVVFASRTELRAWLDTKQGAEAARDRDAADAAAVQEEPVAGVVSPTRRWYRWVGAAAIGLALAGVAFWYAAPLTWTRHPLSIPAPAPATVLLRLTATNGTWSIVGIPVGGMAMSTSVGEAAITLSAVRDGDAARIHVFRVEQAQGGRVNPLTPPAVLTLRQGESAEVTGVLGLAKLEWLTGDALSRLVPHQASQRR